MFCQTFSHQDSGFAKTHNLFESHLFMNFCSQTGLLKEPVLSECQIIRQQGWKTP